MDLISLISSSLFGVYASGDNGIFGVLTSGANFTVNIVKWCALLFVLVKIAMLGFKIVTEAKKSSDALTLVKEEGTALFIGLFVVAGAFLIHSSLKETMKVIDDQKTSDGVEYNAGDGLKFN